MSKERDLFDFSGCVTDVDCQNIVEKDWDSFKEKFPGLRMVVDYERHGEPFISRIVTIQEGAKKPFGYAGFKNLQDNLLMVLDFTGSYEHLTT